MKRTQNKFNNVYSAIATGSCTKKFYPNARNEKKMVCYVDNIHRYMPFGE